MLIGILIIVVAIILYALFSYFRLNIYCWLSKIPQPEFRVIIEKNNMIVMPDGTKLATDVYRPNSLDKFPVIIVRTPYDKNSIIHGYKHLSQLFACQGYVVIVQDIRGKYNSEGEFYPYAYEALDGHTTITWAGEARWSNGRVAMFGMSYSGSCAWLAARYKSPYLKTIISMFTTQNTYSIWVNSGIPFLKGPLMWHSKYTGKKENLKITDHYMEPFLWQLPVNELAIRATHKKIPFFQEYLRHTYPDPYWEAISAHHEVKNFNIPAYIVGGWYDPYIRGTFEDYQRMKEAPKDSLNQFSRLVIGPWAHVPTQKFKEIKFGKDANFRSLLTSMLGWCDTWLKNKETPNHPQKPIRYFMMGKNQWRDTPEWPPKGVEEKKFYLSFKNHSDITHKGYLVSEQPSEEQKISYIYNPRDPVLFRGSRMLRSEGWITPTEQTEILNRDDVLVYHTDPFKQPLCIAGTVKLILYVSSQALDTDFFVKLCDRHPNKKTFDLTIAFLRMRFRDSLKEPKLIEPGKIYKIELLFKPTAHAFLKKHRLQLQITSSDFPVHNRNLNTGECCETSIEIKEALQTIYSGTPYDSHLILPVVPN